MSERVSDLGSLLRSPMTFLEQPARRILRSQTFLLDPPTTLARMSHFAVQPFLAELSRLRSKGDARHTI